MTERSDRSRRAMEEALEAEDRRQEQVLAAAEPAAKNMRQGWYPDPDNAFYRRWWNGDHWTELRGRMKMHPDRVRVRRVATLIGCACAVVFVLATFLHTSVAGVSCGTWISPETIYSTSGSLVGNALASQATQECTSKLEDRRLIALIALGVGLVAKIGLPYVSKSQYDA